MRSRVVSDWVNYTIKTTSGNYGVGDDHYFAPINMHIQIEDDDKLDRARELFKECQEAESSVELHKAYFKFIVYFRENLL